METSLILIVILAVAVLGKAQSVAIAVCGLLIIKLLYLDNYVYPIIEKKGMTVGLIIIIASILIPIAKGDVAQKEIVTSIFSWVGIIAFIVSLLTTYLSGVGANYLVEQGNSNLMPSLILGAVIAASFLGGVPVGPLITSGIIAVILKIFPNK